MRNDRTPYWKEYYAENKERLEARRAMWRASPENSVREKALDRMRYLRRKPNPTGQDLEVIWAISQRYPRRKSFWYPLS